MAQNQTFVDIFPGVWTQLTNSDAMAITFQTQGGAAYVRYTVGAVPPSNTLQGYLYGEGQGERLAAISALTPLLGANRVYAMAASAACRMLVDHA